MNTTMSLARVISLTALALLAFAGNSLLCRAALAHTTIDAASFTTVRLCSGALVLWLLVLLRGTVVAGSGSWVSALALFVYAAGFSFAYMELSAAAGALLLFGAVQTTMIGYGIWSGERLCAPQIAGLVLACAGLAGLLLPGLSAPPLSGALLMLGAGIAWGVYSLRGKGAGDALTVTAGNFARAAPLALALSLLLMGSAMIDSAVIDGAVIDGAVIASTVIDSAVIDSAGIGYAVLSGALASGVGYAIWYAALPALQATTAATVQLSVPVITAVGGIAFLGEQLTLRLVLASVAIIGGIALVVLAGKRTATPGTSSPATTPRH